MILKKGIIEQLSKDLSLPFTGFEQDWDIEMANSSRLDEFIKFYKESKLSHEGKVALMSLVLASYNDLLNEKGLKCDDKWDNIKSELNAERGLFDNLLDYWSLDDEKEKDSIFRITPLIREIKSAQI